MDGWEKFNEASLPEKDSSKHGRYYWCSYISKYISWKIQAWFYLFFSSPGLGWEGPRKKIEIKLDWLTDTDMLLMVGNIIRGYMPCYLSICKSW